MHHLVRQRVLEVLPIPHLVGADQDTLFRVEAATLAMYVAVLCQARWAATACNVGGVEAAVEVSELVIKEADGRGGGEEPVAILLAAAAVALLVDAVPVLAVVEHALAGHVTGEDLEVVHPPFCLGVEAGPGGVVA